MHEVLNLTILLLAFSSVYSIISSFESEKEVSVEVGDNVTLECYLSDQNNSVTWSKLDNLTAILLDDDRFNISSDAKFLQPSSILFINNVSRTDGGIYECQEMFSDENVTTTTNLNATRINLTVRYGPVVHVHNDSKKTLITQVGEDVQLFCDVDRYPKPHVTWRRIHHPSIPKLDDIVFLGNRLSITNTKKEDQGTYSCEAHNGIIEQRTRWNIELQVEFPPEIVLPNAEMSQAVNYTTELVCLVQGFPKANVTWLMDDDQEVNNDTHQYVMTSSEDQKGTSITVLKVVSVQLWDFGNYTCRANNKLGTASSTLTLSESPFPVLPLVKKDNEERTKDDEEGGSSFYNSSFNVTGFILGMMPPLWISFYIILHLGFRSRYAEERPEEEGGDGLDEIVWEQGFHSKY